MVRFDSGDAAVQAYVEHDELVYTDVGEKDAGADAVVAEDQRHISRRYSGESEVAVTACHREIPGGAMPTRGAVTPPVWPVSVSKPVTRPEITVLLETLPTEGGPDSLLMNVGPEGREGAKLSLSSQAAKRLRK